MSSHAEFPRRIVISGVVRARILQLASLAKTHGQLKQFNAAFRTIVSSLQNRLLPPQIGPNAFGCPEYRLNSGWTVCMAIVSPLFVVFSVSESLHARNGSQFNLVILMRVGFVNAPE